MSNPIRLFYSTVTLSWGFTVRYKDASASQPAYVLPPPTTVVGAFTYPLARLLGLRDTGHGRISYESGALITELMRKAMEATITASAGVVVEEVETGAIVHNEISKITASMYKGGTEKGRIRAKPHSPEFYKEALPRIFPAQAVGSAYAPGVKLLLTWVVDVEKLSRSLGLKEEDLDSHGTLISIGVTRIGSKEGIASNDPAESGYDKNPRVKVGESFETVQYVMEQCVEPIEITPPPIIELPHLDYVLKRFYIPSVQASNTVVVPLKKYELRKFRLKEPCRAYQPSVQDLESFTSVGL